MGELIRPTAGAWEKKPGDNGETPGEKNERKKLAAAKGGLSAYDQMQEYYKGAKAADSQANDKAAREVLSEEDLQDVPEEIRDEVRDLYNEYLSGVFEQVGVKVVPQDEEWMYIQAEVEDPGSSPARLLIAGREAAQMKKERLQKMSKQEIVEGMYKR